MDILKSIIVWLTGIAMIIIFFPLTLIIWLLALPFDRNRTIVHMVLTFQACMVSHIVPIWKIRIEGRKKARHGETYVIISNHQSILDILVLNCLWYRFKWISKIEVTSVPVLGWYLKMAGYLTVDRGDKSSKESMLAEAYVCLKKKISIMIFPEGTRSADNEIGFFRRGAFQLAISAGVPILPVIIDGTGSVLPKHGLIFGGFHKINIRVLDAVAPETFHTDDCDELAEKFRILMKDELLRLREQNSAK